MFLHNDKELFIQIINEVSEATDIDVAIIEKDYFVTLFLKYLVQAEPLLVFKGGTCLSKCFNLIRRFSEDLDINLDGVKELTQSRKKQLKEHIIGVIDKLSLTLVNPEKIKSGMDYNLYEVSYPALFANKSLKQLLMVESVFRIGAFPTEIRQASSIMYEYLKKEGYRDIIEKYDFDVFDVRVQTLERTFVDKVFAICDYYLNGRIEAQSRHLYDLYKILPNINFDKELTAFFEEIRKAREGRHDCPSADASVSLTDILKKIIKERTYESDYNNITINLLYEDVTYTEVIESLELIVSNLEKFMQ